MEEIISCTCFENPLCTKCDGRGYYHLEERSLKSITLSSIESSNTFNSLNKDRSPKMPGKEQNNYNPNQLTHFVLADYKKCPYCSVEVKLSRYKKHITQNCPTLRKVGKLLSKNKKHNIKNNQGPKYQTSSFAPITPSYKQEYNMDGSRGLHVRRESNGRFGSYSSHDDYSHESTP